MSVYSDYIKSLSPQNYWRLGEPSGTVAVDEMGVSNATYVNNPTLGGSGAIAYDTATSVTIARGASPKVVNTAVSPASNRVTVSCWFYPTDNTTSLQYLMSTSRDCCGTYYGWNLINYTGGANTMQFQTWNGTATTASVSAAEVTLNQWHMYTGTYDGSRVKLYVDGVLAVQTGVTATALSTTTASFPIRLGAMGYSNVFTAIGRLQECAWWSSALTDTQIAEMYRIGKGTTNVSKTAGFMGGL